MTVLLDGADRRHTVTNGNSLFVIQIGESLFVREMRTVNESVEFH